MGMSVEVEQTMSEEPKSASSDEPGAEERRGWTAAERTTFVISVLVVLALAGTAVVEYFNRSAAATAVFDVTVEVDQAEPQADSFAEPFSVANSAGGGAQNVTVRFEVTPSESDEVVEELSITIDLLPVRAVEEGILLISHDPATHTITGQIESHLLP